MTALLGCSLPLLAACVSPARYERVTPEFEAPASLAGFTRVRSIEFPDSAAGWMYSYRGGPLRPDVYIYPATGASSAPNVTTARLTRLEGGALRKSLPARQRQGWFGAYRVLQDGPVVLEVNGRAITGHRLTALIQYPDEEVVTHQYVFLWGTRFVRIRESHPNGSVAEGELERFTQLLLSSLPLRGQLAQAAASAPD